MDKRQSWADLTVSIVDPPPTSSDPVRRDVVRRDSGRTPPAWYALGAATLVIALVGVVLVAVGRAPATTPSQFVLVAAHKTLEQRTADVTINGTITASGRTVPMTGTGATDFDAPAMSLTTTMQINGADLVQRQLLVAGHMYLGMTIAGHDMSELTHGPHWIGLPLARQPQQLSSGDPLTQLKLLAGSSNKVVSLGDATFAGVKLTGYAVTPTREEMQQGVQRELAALHLTPSERSELQQALTTMQLQPPTIDAWFDSDQLLRTMRIHMAFTGAISASGIVDMTFSHYGTPVNVTAPSPDDVMDYADFLKLLQTSGIHLP